MKRTLFRDAMVWDGSGADAYRADVLVEGQRISAIGPVAGTADDAEVIDCGGRTLMPGFVEGHAHVSFGGAVKDSDLGDIQPEEHLLLTVQNAKTLLDHGFTSVYSAASAKLRLDVVVRNAINAGRIPGPRFRAAGPEITVTAGLGDERKNHMYRESFGMVADGPEEISRAVRLCCREGVDNIKINISGDDTGPLAKGDVTVMREEEVRRAVETARDFNKRVGCHARSAESVKRAVRCGVDVIYHCESADEEALDMLEAAKDRIFVGPAIGLIYSMMYEAEPWGHTRQMALDMGMQRVLDSSARTYAELRKRGVRVLIGGDYGFAWTPQGTNARDFEHFVKLFGYTPSEALQCGTRIGGEVMQMGHELGMVKAGYLADLLLIDGDPLQDLSLLPDARKLLVIMKDGELYKCDAEGLRRSAAARPARHAAAALA
ncbi:amidohydrolase family protein [Variovorax sp. UMC13]|uniref:metal-dependent hydrolase family protein n=1 Tax=Variovorax sp. UMC13 TaxID=1862326 RepID=UPI001602461D|nr:amidohydrolase family protein [Variovorax sp. UMC13]MBB1598471.1 amidohydrolase [Variovorax sp. UMC13]